jgi:N-acetylmuramoyl-L-alanine amidase
MKGVEHMKIMLDAGHGYSTPGKRSFNGMREYEFTRKVAAFAKELLESFQNVSVYFAHSDERDVPLQERTDSANRLHVNAFVSIHGNANGTDWNAANGMETFVYVTKPKEAWELAQKIQTHLVERTGLRNRGVKTADFHVLRETNMTAVLAECGFYTNKNEEALMKTDAFQKTCAEAIVQGISEQFNLVKNLAAQTLFKVQAGAFSDKKNADELVLLIKAKGFNAFSYTEDHTYKVQTGAFSDKKAAEQLASRLNSAGFHAYIHI